MKMKSFIFLIIFAILLNSCLNTQRDVVRCEKYSRMILGEWISVKNREARIKILPNTIITEYVREDEEFGYIHIRPRRITRINIVNELELKDCDDNDYEIPFDDYDDLIDEPLGPSKLRILEYVDDGNRVDTLTIHITVINSEEMRWLSENGHSIPWERKKSTIQDSNFIQDSGTAIEMD